MRERERIGVKEREDLKMKQRKTEGEIVWKMKNQK